MPFKLSEKTVDALLDKLSCDDDFRELFQKNPREALAAVGHAPAADSAVSEGAWMCMSVSQLASKDAIKASGDTLRKQLLTTKAIYNPVNLNISKS